MTIREEARKMARDVASRISSKDCHTKLIEAYLLAFAKLVLEREPSEAASEAFSKSWMEITMPAQTWPERLHRAYRAMTQELIKELE